MRSLGDGPIVIAGAGSLGGYVGGVLARGGLPMRLLGRPALGVEIAKHGLHVTSYEGLDHRFAPGAPAYFEDAAAALAGARIVIVSVKSGATAEMGAAIAAHAPEDAILVSLQNGVSNPSVLREAAPGRLVIPAMAPFNVVRLGQGRLHRGTSGAIKLGAAAPGLAKRLSVAGLEMIETAEIEGVLWGKLLMNLNNALNALSGLPLRAQLQDRAWRRVLAAMIDEALGLMRAAGITPKAAAGAPPALIPRVLRLPDPLFRLAAGAMLKIDPEARSSMYEDLALGRRTEIDALQGEILTLAARLGRAAPLCERVVAAVRAAEAAQAGAPGLGPEAFAAA
ncbi:MAG: 2-dehydropantoate 2-reductase [Pseudomonadota bacterium]